MKLISNQLKTNGVISANFFFFLMFIIIFYVFISQGFGPFSFNLLILSKLSGQSAFE